MTIRQTSLALGTLLATATLALPMRADAQGTDVRDLRPAMILMVDTSGSMERLPQCECTTPSCEECLPACSGHANGGDQRNRWATVLEALTGSWNNNAFYCERQDRTGFHGDDATYPLPHYTNPGVVGQLQDGILDTYVDRAKFALMTFDGVPTTINGPELVPVASWTSAMFSSSRSAAGGYSYGATALAFTLPSGGSSVSAWTAPSYPFRFPDCSEANGYYIDVGARRAADSIHGEVIPGGLITVGRDDSYRATNQAIQDSLLAVRPYGPTPIAGMLEDLRYFLHEDTEVGEPHRVGSDVIGDAFFECRKRYGLLITDGYPNADMRGPPFDCAGAAAGPNGFPGGRNSWCPYNLPETIAQDLCHPTGTNATCVGGSLDGLFVVGFNVADTDAVTVLNDIAVQGGTQHAYFATNLTQLRAAIAQILDVAASGTTSRTTPTFSAGSLVADTQRMSQYSTGFAIDDPGSPWTGVLERRRFECNTSLQPTAKAIEDKDRFHTILNANASRTLYTVVPTAVANVTGHLVGTTNGVSPISSVAVTANDNGDVGRGSGGVSCDIASVAVDGSGAGSGLNNGNSTAIGVERDLTLTPFTTTNAAITPQHFSVATNIDRDAIINWVRGDAGRSVRLGDIYHSSPVIVGPPNADIADESYNEYRRRDVVANRPTVVYVGSNDGVLHAFAAEDIKIAGGPHAATQITAGTELWGFVPPAVFPRLSAARSSHQWLVDGTPVVKDVFYSRAPQSGANGNSYHTILIVGLRGGGGAYIALDVTDPLVPKFLWQFAHPSLGDTVGAPALAQVLLKTGTNQFEERSVALLPGGTGEDLTSSCSHADTTVTTRTQLLGCQTNGVAPEDANAGTIHARATQRCWGTRGRHLYVVDPSTGQLLAHFDDKVFGAPVSGGVSLFTGDVGSISSRAYLTDDDGILWRLDLSNPDVTEWAASPVFDMFYGAYGTEGQPSFGPPIVSTDSSGNVVVLQATGNIDTLDSQVGNRVVSVTDVATFSSAGAADFDATLNWKVVLAPGHLVTGPLQLFDSRVYFATFQSAVTDINACEFGQSFLWGLDYRRTDATLDPVGILKDAGGNPVDTYGPYTNQLVLGVAVTQNLTCADWQNAQRFDPYIPFTQNVQRAAQVNQGGFRLVAQVAGAGGSTANGGSVQEISIDLPSPLSTTRIQGWAGHAD